MIFKTKFSREAIMALAVMVAVHRGYCATGNPLATTPAENFDDKTAGIQIEACSEGGKDVCSIHDGDYILFKNYDFDSGVAGFQARIATPREGSIEIRFDSLTGPLVGHCPFENTGGWQDWRNVSCKADNSQAGIRDVYLIFRGKPKAALINVRSFVFLKSIVASNVQTTFVPSGRCDSVDTEPQGINAWGIPETGFADNFNEGNFGNWQNSGMIIVTNTADNECSVQSPGTGLHFAFTPNVYINKTDTGGSWRTLAEASLAADITIDSPSAKPGIGFSSKDGKQWIYVTLNAAENCLEAWRKLSDGSPTKIKLFEGNTNAPLHIRRDTKYRLQIDWSPYSNGLIVFLRDDAGTIVANFRTVIDLPAARRPLLVCSQGEARFGRVTFDPTLDDWNFKWQWRKTPVLSSDVCNPAIWKWKNNLYYMMWRKFGMDTFHGIAKSADGINWERVNDKILKCRGDMNVLVNPFGDGLVYVTAGSANMPWWSSDGSNDFTAWKDTELTLGDIYGNSRIQEIIDTKQHPQLSPVHFGDTDYRFIAFTENWTDYPQPHTVVLLSNTLTNWMLADPNPLIPPGANFWGEKGNAIGSAFVLPDGNILVGSCSCTFAGYTGAPEPSNVSAIVDGKQPWKVLKLGVLPDVPVSRENVWYQGPNFGTAFYYEPKNDTLFYYGGFHDYNIGVMRIQNFSRSSIFAKSRSAAKSDLSDAHKAANPDQL